MMPKFNLTRLLASILAIIPLIGVAQTCDVTRLTAATPTSRFNRDDNGTVLDKETGLMWKTCSEGQTWNPLTHDCGLMASKFQWEEALFYSEMVNAQGGFANFTDWRVPNIKELLTLVEWQCEAPAINLDVFPNTDSFLNTWSSTSGGPIYHARTIRFSTGHVQSLRRIFAAQVRLVRDQ